MLGFEIDPFHLLPRGSRRMTDDSIQIAATSPAQRRAHGTMREASGTRRPHTSFSAIAERRSSGRGEPRCDRRGNFPPCKALKSHEMRKETRSGSVPASPSRRRPPPSRSSTSRTEALRRPDRGARGRRSRPQMAPQRLEKIKSAPGNGMGSEAPNLQHLVHGRAADGGGSGVGQNVTPKNRHRWLTSADLHSSRIGGRLGSHKSCRKRRLKL